MERPTAITLLRSNFATDVGPTGGHVGCGKASFVEKKR